MEAYLERLNKVLFIISFLPLCIFSCKRTIDCIKSNCDMYLGRECNSASDCPSGWNCAHSDVLGNFCTKSCSTDSDCPSKGRCDSLTDRCVPDLDTECKDNSDCPEGTRCILNTEGNKKNCIPVGRFGLGHDCSLSGASECKSGLCFPGAGEITATCVEHCDSPGSDCDGHEGSCVSLKNMPPLCFANGTTIAGNYCGCSPTQLCVITNNEAWCKESCFDDSDCDSGENCITLKWGFGYCDAEGKICQSTGDCKSLGSEYVCGLVGNHFECIQGEYEIKECSSSSECDTNLCIDGFCSIPCTDDLECNTTLPYCRLIYTNAGYIPICSKTSGRSICSKEDDCSEKESCRPIQLFDGSTQYACFESTGSTEIGSYCTDSEQCIDGFCSSLTSLCTVVCNHTNDCPAFYRCDFVPESSITTSSFDVKECLAPGLRGSYGQLCKKDSDCITYECVFYDDTIDYGICSISCRSRRCPDGMICNPENNYICLIDEASELDECKNDDDCNGKKCILDIESDHLSCRAINIYDLKKDCLFDRQCKSGICSRFGFCTTPCKTHQECVSKMGEGYICTYQRSDEGRYIKVCERDIGSLTPCISPNDCPSGETCSLLIDESGYLYDTLCMKPIGDKGFNQPCQKNEDCATNICNQETLSCTSLCRTDDECPQGSICNPSMVSIKGRNFNIYVCTSENQKGGLGDPCPRGIIDCNGLSCYTDVNGNSFCTRFCDTDQDCDQNTKCYTVTDLNRSICVPKDY